MPGEVVAACTAQGHLFTFSDMGLSCFALFAVLLDTFSCRNHSTCMVPTPSTC